MATPILCVQRLQEVLDYEPDTGVFRWKIAVGRWGRIKPGTVTGSPDANGHLRIQVDGRLYYAHRLAWLYMTGHWPDGDIDHRDGMPSNNRWANLRDVPHQVNAENRRRAHKNKPSGLPMGVSIDRRDGAFRADITVNGRARSLGRFSDPEQAHKAYLKAKRELHVGCTI